jgi:hypothetical protein
VSEVADAIRVENPELDEAATAGGKMTKPETPRPIIAGANAESAMDLLRLGLENGRPVGELREVVALVEHMQERQARQEYFGAIAKFQEEVGPVVRKRQADVATRDGGNMKYAYANVDDVMTDVRPTLVKHGLSVKWGQKLDGGNCTIITTVMHVAGHSETTEFTVPTESRAGMSPQQKVGAATSYGQVRALGLALGITTSDAEPDPIDPTPVNDEQLDEIQDAVEKHEVPVDRLLKALGVKAAGEIRAVDFLRVMQMIDDYAERKAAKAKRGGGS